ALVVLVVAHELRRHAVALEQHARAARVLAGDDGRVAQRAEDAQRDVLEVADRRRADDEPAGHARVPIPSSASAAAPSIPDSAPKRAATIRTCSLDGDSARSATTAR